MTAPSNTVEFHLAVHAVIGPGAVLKCEPATCLQARGEMKTQLTVAIVMTLAVFIAVRTVIVVARP